MAKQSPAKVTTVEANEVEEKTVVDIPSDGEEAEKRPAGEPEDEPETKKAKKEENGVKESEEESKEDEKEDSDEESTEDEEAEKPDPVDTDAVKTLESSEEIKKAEAVEA